jgi:vitamin B12/bleomycin/antimicrobial peptide transport system ATP-binding/permease protein
VVTAATAFGQIKLNAWNQPFYNLERRDVRGFFVQLVIFCIISVGSNRMKPFLFLLLCLILG